MVHLQRRGVLVKHVDMPLSGKPWGLTSFGRQIQDDNHGGISVRQRLRDLRDQQVRDH